MNTKTILAAVLVAVFLFFGLGLFAYNFYVLEDVQHLDMYLKVADTTGINADTDALYFGRVLPGTRSTRMINLTNYNYYPVTVNIKISGDLKDTVYVSENNFVLQPQQRNTITYYADTHENMSYGNYTGTTTIVIKRQIFG